LLKFRVDKTLNVCVTITEDPTSGGVVLTNPTLNPDVNAPKFCFRDGLCYPSQAPYTQRYNDWQTLGRPKCWCAKPDGSGYQCDGDVDGLFQGPQKYRVMTNDLAKLIPQWKTTITTITDPCADVDHKAQGPQNYRVMTNDLAVLITNWKKTDAQLPGNCPRP
jgi:hypothetical protein